MLYFSFPVFFFFSKRIFNFLKSSGKVENYAQMINNFFRPLFEATLYPEQHENLSKFLLVLSGFDSVDDESVPDAELEVTSGFYFVT